MLHPVSSRASQTSGILVQFIRHSCLIDYHNIWLDFGHWRYFGSSKRTFALHIDLDTSTSLHDGRNRKYITSMFWPCQLFFVKCRQASYMRHHLWSETRQTRYSVGVTVRLESALSALHLVKKMKRVKERRSSNHATKDHPEEITKNLHGRFCINSYFIKFVGQNLINLM